MDELSSPQVFVNTCGYNYKMRDHQGNFQCRGIFRGQFSAFAGILNGSVTAYDTRARFQITAPFFGPRIRAYLNTGHWWQSKPE